MRNWHFATPGQGEGPTKWEGANGASNRPTVVLIISIE